jgi:ribosomal protein S27E
MERHWYLSREGKVFGPVNDAQLLQAAATGRVQPTDLLNVAGEPYWHIASTIPGLFHTTYAQSPNSAPQSVRVTCFACFTEVLVALAHGTTAVQCPKCGAALQTGETAPASGESSDGAGAFEALENPAVFKARLQAKVRAAYAAEAADFAIAAGALRGLVRGAADASASS